jgi:hypothetical protein
MPAGAGPLALAYFAGVKLAGYCAFSGYLNRQFSDRKANPYLAGATRTAIGFAAGAAAVALMSLANVARGEWLFLVFLIPVRIGEWLLLLRLFYRKPSWDRRKMLYLAVQGTVWSFLLDIPALIAVFVLPGGIWIC